MNECMHAHTYITCNVACIHTLNKLNYIMETNRDRVKETETERERERERGGGTGADRKRNRHIVAKINRHHDV